MFSKNLMHRLLVFGEASLSDVKTEFIRENSMNSPRFRETSCRLVGSGKEVLSVVGLRDLQQTAPTEAAR